jgi:ABC-type phosphate transport system substrate-binding protein
MNAVLRVRMKFHLRKFFVTTLLCVVGLSFAASSALAGELLVVVGAQSPLTALDKNQVRNIFLGKVSAFPDGSSVIPIDQPESSPLRDEFYTKVANRSASEVKARWAQLAFTGRGEPPRVGAGSGDIKKILNSTSGTIGYIGKSDLDSSVKIVLIVE